MTANTNPNRYHECENLLDMARRFKREPYVIYRGTIYEPLVLGPAETPAYRRSTDLANRGEIVTAWPDGKAFDSQVERDEACLEDASTLAPDDPARLEAVRFVRRATEKARTRAARHHSRQGNPASEND